MDTMKEKREKLGMTQVEVAVYVGCSLTSYRLWESGVTKPKAENKEKLEKLFREGE